MRRSLLSPGVWSILLLTLSMAAVPAFAVSGDVNGDGSVNLKDALELCRFLDGNQPAIGQPQNADVDGNGTIDEVDRQLLLRAVIGCEALPDLVEVPDVVGQSQAAAEALIVGVGLAVGDVSFAANETVPAGDVIDQDPDGGTRVASGSPVDLVVSTGQALTTVPDVVGELQADAEAAIVAADLIVGNVTTDNSDTVEAGRVISQDPTAGTSVPEGSAVDLVISLGPVLTTVPDVVGDLQADAEATIVAANLIIGNVTTDNSDTVEAGRVISQDPTGGTSVPLGSAVDLVISLGPALTTVPDVIDELQADAEAAIVAADLIVGNVTTANSDTVEPGRVISQDPTAGTSVPEGSAVDLVISLGPVLTTVPDVVGDLQADAEAAIVAADLIVGNVTAENSDTVEAGRVISQDPIGGTSVPEGSAVDLVISRGPAETTVPDVVGQLEADAAAAIVAADLIVGNVTTVNSDTVEAGRVINQDPTGGTSVPLGSAVDLVISLGPALTTVPDVLDELQADAEAAIVAANLIVGNVTTANSDTVEAGRVISQDPIGGTSVPEGSAVDLVISLGPVLTTVPDVVGSLQADAEAAIIAADLIVGNVTTANSDTVEAGRVISQDPTGGNSVPEGSAVDLVISLGPVLTTVPDVVNELQADAEAAIIAADLIVGNVTTANSDTVEAGRVISQDPTGGTTVAEGTAVDLVVSLGPVQVLVPDVVGLPQANAEAAIAAASLTVGNVTAANSDTVPAGSVISQNPIGGTTVAEGSAVDLVVSLGPAVTTDDEPPTVTIVLVPEFADPDEPVLITIVANDNSGVAPGVTATLDGAPLALDPSNQATFSSPTPGSFEVVATATDGSGNIAQAVDRIKVRDPNDTTPPIASLVSPADLTEVTFLTDLIGTASDDNLSQYRLGIRRVSDEEFTTFFEGTGNVVNDKLAELDPTLRENGIYRVQLEVQDTGGLTATAEKTYVINGEAKVGAYRISFTDLSIPVAGIPITITRTYDSRVKSVEDFGVGWTLDVRRGTYEHNRTPGLGWQILSSGGFFSLPCRVVSETAIHVTEVRFSEQEWYQFKLSVGAPATTGGGCVATASFVFIDGSSSGATLAILGSTDLLYTNGSDVVQDFDPASDDFLQPYNPRSVRLTTPDGRQVDLDRDDGVTRIKDLNDNALTIDSNGIAHSSGMSITFDRDASERITGITDPMGNVLQYVYDARGDLAESIDSVGNSSTYAYDSRHNLTEILDPTGNRSVRSNYDDDGRLVEVIDAGGNRLLFSHDTDNRTEVVTDRLGNVTVMQYNARGDVVHTTDSLGNVSQSSYDARGNTLTRTDPLGNTSAFTYDARNHMLTEIDGLGRTTTRTYNSIGRPLTRTRHDGTVSVHTYDNRGNLLTSTDPEGNVITRTYSNRGLLLTETDADGSLWSFTYDSSGRETSVTDPLGVLSETTYDDNGNRLTESVTRTVNGGQQQLTTRFEYDARGRLIRKIDPLGGLSERSYTPTGKLASETDALGRVTTYTYDEQERLESKGFPDGTTESMAYDAEGQEISRTDRGGRVTLSAYDAVGRPVQTTHPDGTTTGKGYDAAGRVLTETDERGGVSSYTYDAAGQRTSFTNPAAEVIAYGFDAVGNLVTRTDGLGQVVTYEYDDAGRQNRIVHPDGTSETKSYSDAGRLISETDQAGVQTTYGYDPQGRLTSLTDALGQVTTYVYDEVGNLVSQTDAAGRTTTFEYDALGRRTKRTLPLGQQETLTYDAINKTAHTDFRGLTTTFAYDAMNRMTGRTPDPGLGEAAVSWTYTPAGERATMQDPSGLTTYGHDQRDRLTSKATPFGTLTYTYDGAGNLASIRSSNAAGVSVDYTYDPRNRLSSVIDNRLAPGTTTYAYDSAGNMTGMTAANGVVTTVSYDSLNRLTNLEVSHNAATLASFLYTLAPAGQRAGVSEAGGRTVTYVYDDLYRLTRETIAGDALPGNDGSIDYTYDEVGNRLSRTSSVAAVGSNTYTYDANDRLTTSDHDANGNVTGAGGTIYEFDSTNRLVSVDGGAISYVHDGDGNRVARTVGGVTTHYLIDEENATGFPQVLEEIVGGNVVRTYTYGNDLLSQLGAEGAFFHTHDAQSVRLLTDAAGNPSDSYRYDAFGNLLEPAGAVPNVYRYAGEQVDPDLDLIYLRARYLDPDSGRFRGMDPHPGVMRLPITLHDYLYANASPINHLDPGGETTLMSLSLAGALTGILASIAIHDIAGLAGSDPGPDGLLPRGSPLQQVKDLEAQEEYKFYFTAAAIQHWDDVGSVAVGALNNICSNVGFGEGCVAWQGWMINWTNEQKTALAPRWDRVNLRKVRTDIVFFEHHFGLLQVGRRSAFEVDPWRDPFDPFRADSGDYTFE